MRAKITMLKQALAILLILATLCTVLASCADEVAAESDSSTNDASNTIYIESENGTIPIYANGEYQAKLIRSDTATTFDKDI